MPLVERKKDKQEERDLIDSGLKRKCKRCLIFKPDRCHRKYILVYLYIRIIYFIIVIILYYYF